jgi:hypothetical protein
MLLSAGMFEIEVDGKPASRREVLPKWGPHDRVGVVADRPFGALGASLLMQLAITAFYDERPARRGSARAIYPELYLFHVGGYWGDHAPFDLYPARKEVEGISNPRAALEAINDRGITRLLVPDRAPGELSSDWERPESRADHRSAIDRIATAYAYSPDGRVDGSTVSLTGLEPAAEQNATMTLHPDTWTSIRSEMERESNCPELLEQRYRRLATIMAHAEGAERRWGSRRDAEGRVRETHRHIAVDTAIRMLPGQGR